MADLLFCAGYIRAGAGFFLLISFVKLVVRRTLKKPWKRLFLLFLFYCHGIMSRSFFDIFANFGRIFLSDSSVWMLNKEVIILYFYLAKH